VAVVVGQSYGYPIHVIASPRRLSHCSVGALEVQGSGRSGSVIAVRLLFLPSIHVLTFPNAPDGFAPMTSFEGSRPI
jgi:hypothetical protein